MKAYPEEHLVERRVRYTFEHEGRVYLIENVPARINEETGDGPQRLSSVLLAAVKNRP